MKKESTVWLIFVYIPIQIIGVKVGSFIRILKTIYSLKYRFYNYLQLKMAGGDLTGLTIVGSIHLRNRGIFKVGENVKINSSISANPVKGNKTVIFIDENARLIIGNNVGISNSSIYSELEIEICDDVFIGAGVSIYDSNFHSLDYFDRVKGGDQNVHRKGIKIGKGAFIGAGVTILKGCNIGDGAVLGACSVLTKSVPAGEIWAGNPARFIKFAEYEVC